MDHDLTPMETLDPARASVLMVDDHPANLVALEAVLSPLGHRLVRANSGEEAFRRLLDEDFAVILMDVQMPHIDGFKTAALIRARKRTRHVPIIFLTAINTELSHIIQGYAHGAVDYLLKPFDPEILKSKVSVFAELFLQRERLQQQAALLHLRELEALERRSDWRYRTVIDSMSHCVWALRPDGEVYYANRAWLVYSGQGEEGNQYWGLVHPEDQSGLEAKWTGARSTGQGFELQYRLLRDSDRAYRWHLGRAVAELDEEGRIFGWIATATDIDDQKRVEEELQLALQSRDDFFSIASHELRTPLTSLQLTVQGLLRNARLSAGEGLSPAESATVARKARTVEQQVRRQTRLVEELLDFSRSAVQGIQLALEEVDLAAVVREVAGRFEDAIETAGCSLSIRAPGSLVGRWDPMRLDQVITNLLSNALKYGQKQPIEIVVERSASRALLRVSDHGIGIAPQDQSRIFERFGRAVSRRDYGGFGLGLWISRQIVEALGGSIRLESELGAGSTFTVELPVGTAVSESDRPEEHPATILIVEDDGGVRESLEGILRGEGYPVDTARNGQEALTYLAKHEAPGLILLDLMMPVMDGQQFRNVQLQDPAIREIPTVILSAARESERKARALSVEGCLQKPIDLDELLKVVRHTYAPG